MVYRKGERTNRNREAAWAFAVDIPVPSGGLGLNLNRIHEGVAAAGGEVRGWRDEPNGRDIPVDWVRCGFHKAEDADAFAAAWSDLNARRAR
jgi:hypothetical protein